MPRHRKGMCRGESRFWTAITPRRSVILVVTGSCRSLLRYSTMPMQNELSYPIAVLDPRKWRLAVRHLRTSEGWWPPMFVLAVLGSIGLGGGLVQGPTLATVCLHIWAALGLVVSSIAVVCALFDSVRNILRLGIAGLRRNRIWYELARSSCNLGILSLVAIVVVAYFELVRLEQVGNLARIPFLFLTAFAIFATMGHVVSFLTRRRAFGRAGECVHFFYPLCLSGAVVACFIFAFRNRPGGPMFAIVCLVLFCMAGAGIVTLVNWQRHRLTPNAENSR